MTCGSCDADEYLDELDDGELCVDGDVYGYCGDINCYGSCEYLGYCTCQCHGIPEDAGPLTRTQLEAYKAKAKETPSD